MLIVVPADALGLKSHRPVGDAKAGGRGDPVLRYSAVCPLGQVTTAD